MRETNQEIGAPRMIALANDTPQPRHDTRSREVSDLADNWLRCLYAIMDSLANYASDGDNSNNSDDVKVRNREDTHRMVED